MHISKYQIISTNSIEQFTIALLADLHGKPYNLIIDSLIDYRPDYIAIVGDVITNDEDSYPLGLFADCSKIAKTFFSLGNHERKITSKTIKTISHTGIVVLDNRWIRIENILFGGMTSPFVTEWRETHKTVHHNLLPKTEWLDEFEKQDGYKILLDHHPENFIKVTRDRNIDLILSGHAHGGQIRMFNHGIYAPHQGFFPKYTSGVYENRLVVSRGLANIKPIPRLGNPTELVYIQVKSCKK